MDLDTSQRARDLLEEALIHHTFYGTNAENAAQNATARQRILNRLFDRLGVLINQPKVRFEMNLNASHVHRDHEILLFREIANIICTGGITEIHAMVHGQPVQHWEHCYKQVYSWNYHSYEFIVYTRRIFNGNDFYMQVVDRSKQQPDDSDSMGSTEHDEVEEPPGPPLNLMLSSLRSIHNRLASLEGRRRKKNILNQLDTRSTSGTAINSPLMTLRAALFDVPLWLVGERFGRVTGQNLIDHGMTLTENSLYFHNLLSIAKQKRYVNFMWCLHLQYLEDHQPLDYDTLPQTFPPLLHPLPTIFESINSRLARLEVTHLP